MTRAVLSSFMTNQDSAIGSSKEAPPSSTPKGTLFAALGVLAFSFSFPGTVWALDGFGPWSTAGVRGVLATGVAALALRWWRAPLPRRDDWGALVTVSLGCAIGFPLLTTLALQTSTTAHSAVVIGALPMATASISAWRTGTRHSPLFWAAAATGAIAVLVFALSQNHGLPSTADLYLLGALLLCAAGYAEGGRLSSHMPGGQVIAWGVVLATPVNAVVTIWALTIESVDLTGTAVAGILYVGTISQFLGFVAWYRGMGEIGVSKASQIQLAQPLLTFLWAVLLMGEHLAPAALLTALIVLTCIVVTQKVE